MCSRVRKLKDNNICVFLNNLPYKEKASFYKYDEVKCIVETINNKYNNMTTVSTVIENSDGTVEIKTNYKFGLYEQIIVHNELENANKKPYYFVPLLIKLIKNKGHTYELLDEDGTYEKIDMDKIKNELLEVADISGNE